MSDVFLSNEVLIYLFSETVLYILLCIAFIYTIDLIRHWDFRRFDEQQFLLEKRAYLVMSVTLFVFMVKIIITPYFTFTVDNLAVLIPGAMCAAGVVAANEFGYPLLYLKIAILFATGSWIIINKLDLKATTYPYFKIKSWLFVIVFTLISVEFFLNYSYFEAIETSAPVSCCSAIYTAQSGGNTLPLGLDITKLLTLFYLLFGLTIISNINRYDSLHVIANILFLMVSYYAVIYFFGTYVYEIPTHQCPFCMLQSEYHYMGYLIWISLLLGTFFGINSSALQLLLNKEMKSVYNISLIFNLLFVFTCSLYVALFYFNNGVFL
ncbi:MAG: hypothetical protein U9P71_02815 [Campylobacterota bacterium]|nr:hypothetical protein [Campylobacterota bacterium]